MTTASGPPKSIIICVTIILATLLSYTPLLHNAFVAFDDNIYIYQNAYVTRGLTWEGLRYAFSLNNGISYWQPLTLISLMLDYQIFGLNPVGYHMENLLIHLINAILLFNILRLTTCKAWTSAAAAIFFALHPSAVESVAWAIERKTVLSSLFMFLSIYSYVYYSKAPSILRYTPVFLCMLFGLMSKSMIVTLPALLLIMDFWPLGRFSPNSTDTTRLSRSNRPLLYKLVIEKLPLAALSILSVGISIVSLGETHEVMKDTAPFASRALHAVVSYSDYIARLLWPSGHAVFYPLPSKHAVPEIILAASILLLISFAAVSYSKKYPWLLAGWLWYVIALFPMSGLVRSGLWPGIADRFTYLPYIGLYSILAWGTLELISSYPGLKNVSVVFAGLVFSALGYATFCQTMAWKDTVSLFSDAVRLTPGNAVAHEMLGKSLITEHKNYSLAELHINEAIRLDPFISDAHHDLGELRLIQGRPADALPHLRYAVLIMPRNAEYLNSLASALLETDSPKEALPLLETALKAKPGHINALYNRALALLKLGNPEEAEAVFAKVLAAKPDFHEARTNTAHLLIARGEYKKAIIELNRVLDAMPYDLAALGNLGRAYEMTADTGKALEAYRKILAVKPADAEAAKAFKQLQKKNN